MKQYELLCVLRGTLSQEDVPATIAKVKDILEKQGATIVGENDMGKSRIAYPIKHIRYGYFHLFLFDAEGSAVPQIQEKLRLEGELLRAVITHRTGETAADMTVGIIDEISREKKQRRSTPKTDKKDQPAKPAAEKTPAEPAPKEEPVAEEKEEKKAEESKKEETKTTTPDISMEEIDQKLDQILQSDLDKV